MPDNIPGHRLATVPASDNSDENVAALALDLASRAAETEAGLILVDATGDRLDDLARFATGFDQNVEVLVMPAPDTLPYDRSAPSAAVTGRRVATLASLAASASRRRLVLTSARAMLGRVPPPSRWRDAGVTLAAGQIVDPTALAAALREQGYVADEHVDEPGQMAVRGHVIDVFPGDAPAPFRLALEDGAIAAIHQVDPASQRSEPATLSSLTMLPVREMAPGAGAGPDATDGLVCLLDYLPGAAILLQPDVEERWAELHQAIDDAYAATQRARRAQLDGPNYLPPPSRLFCSSEDIAAALARHAVRPAELGRAARLPPVHGPAAAAAAIRAGLAHGQVIVAGGAGAERLHAALSRRAGLPVRLAAGWRDAATSPAGIAAITDLALDTGFARDGLSVIAVPGPRKRSRTGSQLLVEEPPAVGDLMVHRERGMCRLRGLTTVGAEERVALEFADDAELLVPPEELDQVWRYGSEAGPAALDKLDGSAWRRRRDEISAEIAATARELAAAAAARAQLVAPVIEPPTAPYARFVRRFAFPLSPDQVDAIQAVLADMSSGRPMDRLVCGDVGFGKTEVALRAAAAAALSGHQVAVMAPTTVLARQHYDVFTQRFAGLGVRVAPMLRGAGTQAGRDVRAGLADGGIQVVVGTHAIAADGLRFKDLALVVIDEEQRFGDAHKKRLAALRNPAGGAHALVMTATPIPRTLQSAVVGLREISVIATPPMRRQPTRTYALPWDPVVVREALGRERSRGGQSFVVCPRIEDLAPVAARLAELAPELSVVTAHGRMRPAELEQAVSEFAAGEHDVLLATNIIEAGLDIPRANTMLVTWPDRFGLSQLHQLRGRVGRGSRRGAVYLLTEPGHSVGAATLRRLRTLERQTQLGAGTAISLADMDARGAGDLFGELQAGHVRTIGTELYQRLLRDELAAGRGEQPMPARPDVQAETAARIPKELVPEANLRLELYRRLATVTAPGNADDLAEEMEDRFGKLPPPVLQLLDLARLRGWCCTHGVTRLQAGPQAVALTLADPATADRLVAALPFSAGQPAPGGATVKDGRLILPLAVADPLERLGKLCGALMPE